MWGAILFIGIYLGRFYANQRYKSVMGLYDRALKNIDADSNYLESLIEWKTELETERDKATANYLNFKKRPAKKAAEEVREARKDLRIVNKELAVLKHRLFTYESFAPWLIDYVEMPTRDLLAGLKERQANALSDDTQSEDPVKRYLTPTEWTKLSASNKNQIALDRYLDKNRRKGLWTIGVEYERFIGFLHEKKGYRVIYHGALEGKSDLGIDLICESDSQLLLIQCKRLSELKGIPIRENVIAQLSGSRDFFRMKHNPTKPVQAALYTSYVLSEDAKHFAQHLGIEVFEHVALDEYPTIKCNISSSGEKIYHLPMDQQYDNVVIDFGSGEFYASTVTEAEKGGFRRAFRWSGVFAPI